MRSRAARLTLSATAWIALGAAAFFLVSTEHHLTERRAALRTFDRHAREAADLLADARAGQQAYVAAGQSSAFWIPKVAEIVQQASATIDGLRASASGGAARQSLMDASTAVTEFGNVDKRVRDYLTAREPLMASDVAFSEGGDAASRARLQIEAARLSEHQVLDADEAAERMLEAYAAGSAGAFAALILAVLGFGSNSKIVVRVPAPVPAAAAPGGGEIDQLPLRTIESPTRRAAPGSGSNLPTPALKAAAELCTEFGRMHDLDELKALIGRAARLLDAHGLVVWLGDAAGSDLRPLIAHGYGDQVLALMRAVPRTADNAAAAAYRSGTLQIVTARTGKPLGAIVAPLLSAEGCVGALAAEIRDGGDMSENVQALASIFAAQLAGALAPSTPAAAVPEPTTATAESRRNR